VEVPLARSTVDALGQIALRLCHVSRSSEHGHRARRLGDTDERVVQGIHLTINGIAAGLRNSG